MKVITESDLRSACSKSGDKTVRIPAGTKLTQPARDYVKEHGLEVIDLCGGLPKAEDAPHYKDAYLTDIEGRRFNKKPEHMTHLRGRTLVPKSHPVIAFRGKMDSLMAEILNVQTIAHDKGEDGLLKDLDEMLSFVRILLASEVKQTAAGLHEFIGHPLDSLREMSHDPQRFFGMNHLTLSYQMGGTVIALNKLRTAVREAELAAIRAFPQDGGEPVRPDLIYAINRLSSAVYVMMYRALTSSAARREENDG